MRSPPLLISLIRQALSLLFLQIMRLVIHILRNLHLNPLHEISSVEIKPSKDTNAESHSGLGIASPFHLH